MIFSPYETRARVFPGLLGITPIAVAIVSLGLGRFPTLSVIGGILSAVGGTYLLSLLVGNLGCRVQSQWWIKWGGPPTTRLLRLREPTVNATRRAKWRDDITTLTGVRLFDELAEIADPSGADEAIETAVGACRYLGHAGDDGHPMVQSESAQYGFERNLYAFRCPARVVSFLTVVGMAICIRAPWEVPVSNVIVGLVINTVILIGWALLPSEKRAKSVADKYAIQLLNAVSKTVQKSK